jgi:hypothetical protein
MRNALIYENTPNGLFCIWKQMRECEDFHVRALESVCTVCRETILCDPTYFSPLFLSGLCMRCLLGLTEEFVP